ncbi:MAG TPA: hypothetical protein VFI24_11220 [Pyrinomonadaceae bacterium]|nr:hypothetical protein [Pyrinomonadaceae bacterium]
MSRFLVAGALLFSLTLIVFSQTGTQPQRKLTDSEQSLVDGSRKVIIETGISESYFNTHFKLLNVSDKPSDRRVVWQLSVNQYQAVLSDSIGYYTDGGKRVDTHSIAKSLGQTSEIQTTISRVRAMRLMKSCIGNFENPAVEYGPVDGRAELLLTAHARKRVETKSEREREREREREERAKRKATAAGTDVVESEEDEGESKPLLFGAINLQTGKCTKGAGVIAP